MEGHVHSSSPQYCHKFRFVRHWWFQYSGTLRRTKLEFTCLLGLVALHCLTSLDSTQPAKLHTSETQLVEHLSRTQNVVGSNPAKAAQFFL